MRVAKPVSSLQALAMVEKLLRAAIDLLDTVPETPSSEPLAAALEDVAGAREDLVSGGAVRQPNLAVVRATVG